jgi:hypothetical protein
MKFMSLQDYAPTEGAAAFIGAWSLEDAAAHIEFQRQMNHRLTESGELVEAQALTTPEQAKFETIATTSISVPGTAWDWVGLNQCTQISTNTTPASPNSAPITMLRRNPATPRSTFACAAITALNTTTPTVAPIGSANVPSHFKTELTVFEGLVKSSSGPTTVGPRRRAPPRARARPQRKG